MLKVIIAGLALVTSLGIAGIAAWFSIIGLMAIFSGLPGHVMIMASSLEAGKLVTAAWLKNNWSKTGFMMKSALTSMVIVLMLITSLGIFGLLSKAHVEQGAPVADNTARIERLDQRIGSERKEIDDAQRIIDQLDETVQTLIEYDRIRGNDGAIATRKSQEEQRADLKEIIDSSEENIDKLLDQKFELEQEVRSYEVEVGPIKYVAALVSDDPDASQLEKAVRIVILMLIFVFDPLAVLLLLAANQNFIELARDRKKPESNVQFTREEVETPEVIITVSPPQAEKAYESPSTVHEGPSEDTTEAPDSATQVVDSIAPQMWPEVESEMTRKGFGRGVIRKVKKKFVKE